MTHHSQHHLYFQSAISMADTRDNSVDLTVTSPPYPMIAMWDESLAASDPAIKKALKAEDGMKAFEAMHRYLDTVWDELARVTKTGGFAAINIGDATRSMAGEFACYPNHSRITMGMIQRGFTPLPEILWRKVSTAPNKFMGSGMLPAGAYVTQEHEYILLFRKGGKRVFKVGEPKEIRSRSAMFWEERNRWYSDTWSDVSGVRQETSDKELRQRSAAYPLELPMRLILMYSAEGDTILDPFSGTGTTMQAAMVTGRSSVSYETDQGFQPLFHQRASASPALSREISASRYKGHLTFVEERFGAGKAIKNENRPYGMPVITKQEAELILPITTSVEEIPGGYQAEHGPYIAPEGSAEHLKALAKEAASEATQKRTTTKKRARQKKEEKPAVATKPTQQPLF